MTFYSRTGKVLPKVITDQAAKVGNDAVNRREFLAMAADYGVHVYRFESGHERELASSDWPEIRNIRDIPLDVLRNRPLIATGSLYMLAKFCDWLNLDIC